MSDSTVVARTREQSLELLHRAATPAGFVASPSFDHYTLIWARDALITSLGACATTDPSLHRAVANTIDTLAAHASPLGQIPAVVSAERREWDFGEGGVVDATAWLPVVVEAYLTATDDLDRVEAWWPAVQAAISWLRHQDVTGTRLLSVAPSTDWMDAALTRSGRTLGVNAIYAWATSAADRLGEALGLEPTGDGERVARAVDRWFWPDSGVEFASLFDHGFAHTSIEREYHRLAGAPRTHYASHIVHAAFVERCDVLANLLAILAGIPSDDRARAILEYLTGAADPWPSRAFMEPIEPGDPSGMYIEQADAAIDARWRNLPGRYHNGAAWPFIGGFHVVATSVVLGAERARALLAQLAETLAMHDWSFPEWIDSAGAAEGARDQVWNAGTFLLGDRAVADAAQELA